MKNIALFKKRKDVRQKKFFLHSVGLLVLALSFDEARQLLLSIFVVLLSKTIGICIRFSFKKNNFMCVFKQLCIYLGTSKSKDTATPCEVHKKHIDGLIMGIREESDNECSDYCSDDESEEVQNNETQNEPNDFDQLSEMLDNSNDTPIAKWIDFIFKEAMAIAKANDDGEFSNIMYNRAFAKHLKRLCKLLPLWSSICCQYFENSPDKTHSNNAESYFSDLKNSLRSILPCRVDQFLINHLDSISGKYF